MQSRATIDDFMASRRPRRRVAGVAAALLPFTSDGRIDEEDFADHLRATAACGLTNAVNMDTGYVNLLSAQERRHVLSLARAALGRNEPLIAGAYVEDGDGPPIVRYHREIETILRFDATPILFQTAAWHGASAADTADLYRQACAPAPRAIAFELGRMFAPNGEIWDDEMFARTLEIPQLAGLKHSSLDRATELRRIQMRNRLRPDFVLYTGNDLAIDMIEYGSDYLLGLATFCPEQFAARDLAWELGDGEYLTLTDALQHLGNVAFRPPVPAYRHSAAIFLHLQGRILASEPHPAAPRRPAWEAELLRSCLDRLRATG